MSEFGTENFVMRSKYFKVGTDKCFFVTGLGSNPAQLICIQDDFEKPIVPLYIRSCVRGQGVLGLVYKRNAYQKSIDPLEPIIPLPVIDTIRAGKIHTDFILNGIVTEKYTLLSFIHAATDELFFNYLEKI